MYRIRHVDIAGIVNDGEVKTLRGKTQNIMTSFDAEYAKLPDSFRDLVSARDKHIIVFGKDARYYLNQLVICLWEQGLTYGKEIIMEHPNTPYLQEILDVTIQGLDEIDAIL